MNFINIYFSKFEEILMNSYHLICIPKEKRKMKLRNPYRKITLFIKYCTYLVQHAPWSLKLSEIYLLSCSCMKRQWFFLKKSKFKNLKMLTNYNYQHDWHDITDESHDQIELRQSLNPTWRSRDERISIRKFKKLFIYWIF